MTSVAEEAIRYWHRGPGFSRFFADLIAGGVARLRHTNAPASPHWPADLHFGSSELDLDSLERVRLAASVVEALQFPSSERPDRLREMDRLDEWMAEAQRCLAAGSTSVGFRTSGSTGCGRLVVHEMSVLAEEIESLAAIFKDRRRVVSVVPAHHIYGFLFTVLLPLRLGIDVVDGRAHAPPTLRTLVQPGDLIVTVPMIWELMCGGAWPEDIAGVNSGAPCPASLAVELRRDGLSRLVEIYGSTETSGIGWREEPGTTFQLFAHLARQDDDTICRLSQGARKPYLLPDVVTWSGPRQLTPVRRRDGAVQVGGVNVYLKVIRSVLVAHPQVKDARVRLMRLEEGDRIKAFVVPTDQDQDEEQLRAELEAWAAERLQVVEQPRAYTFGPGLPVNAMGKASDWNLL